MTKWDKKVGANIANHATYIFDGENLKRYLTSFNPTFFAHEFSSVFTKDFQLTTEVLYKEFQ